MLLVTFHCTNRTNLTQNERQTNISCIIKSKKISLFSIESLHAKGRIRDGLNYKVMKEFFNFGLEFFNMEEYPLEIMLVLFFPLRIIDHIGSE